MAASILFFAKKSAPTKGFQVFHEPYLCFAGDDLLNPFQREPSSVAHPDVGQVGQAEQVQMVASNLQTVDVERRSTRTGQRHPLGGFAGEVEYRGELSQLIPFIRAGEWTGVGRQTVWGKGQFSAAFAVATML